LSTADDPRDSRFLDRFGVVLILVLATVCAQALIDVRDHAVGALVTRAISGLALVMAVRAGGVPRRWRRAADLVVILSLVGNTVLVAIQLSSMGSNVPVNNGVLWLVTAALVPVAVAHRVLHHRRVTIETVMGAVAAYVQIAVAYALLLQALDAVTPGHLFGSAVPTTTYIYVSLETITTLGYGDYLATTDLGRLMLVSEALLGQVYLVVFVALIVSRFATPSADTDPQ
jgi:Ion channel